MLCIYNKMKQTTKWQIFIGLLFLVHGGHIINLVSNKLAYEGEYGTLVWSEYFYELLHRLCPHFSQNNQRDA